jgi:dihydrofolate reductase
LIVSLIVAMDEKGGIGYENRLPWRLPADLQRFKSVTMGHHLIMGRKTYESIGRSLPGRTTIVITRQVDYPAQGALIAHSLPQALQMAESRGESEAFVIGGGQIFRQALDRAYRIYLTQVHAELQADTHFPILDASKWEALEVSEHLSDERNEYPFTYKVLEKKKEGIGQ